MTGGGRTITPQKKVVDRIGFWVSSNLRALEVGGFQRDGHQMIPEAPRDLSFSGAMFGLVCFENPGNCQGWYARVMFKRKLIYDQTQKTCAMRRIYCNIWVICHHKEKVSTTPTIIQQKTTQKASLASPTSRFRYDLSEQKKIGEKKQTKIRQTSKQKRKSELGIHGSSSHHPTKKTSPFPAHCADFAERFRCAMAAITAPPNAATTAKAPRSAPYRNAEPRGVRTNFSLNFLGGQFVGDGTVGVK